MTGDPILDGPDPGASTPPARHVGQRTVDPHTLIPYEGNPNIGDVDAVRESLRANGQYRSPVTRILPDGQLQVLAGHTTRLAAIAEGLPLRVDVIEADDRTARRIVLADNRTAQRARYDETLLLEILDGGDLAGTGWDDAAYRELLDGAGTENPFDHRPGSDGDDADEEPPEEPVTQAGDAWICGPHRILCGSSTSREDLDIVLAGERPGIVHTDPPYGIDIVKGGAVGGGGPVSGSIGGGKFVPTTKYKPVIGDDTTDTARDAFRLIFGAYPEAMHVWWGANHYAGAAELPNASCWIVWDKQNGETYFADAELAWTNHPGAVRIFRHMWNGMIRASERGKRVHPNQKPYALAEWSLDLVDPDRKRRVVLDGFGGSGSTLIAAHLTGRAARVIEMDPAYCDVIARRWQTLTGEMPVLERTGEPVDLTAATAAAR